MKTKLNKLTENEVANAEEAAQRYLFMLTVDNIIEKLLCLCMKELYACSVCGKYRCREQKNIKFDFLDTMHL